jgi:hypothetical protein
MLNAKTFQSFFFIGKLQQVLLAVIRISPFWRLMILYNKC